jgi:lipopolysaccharide/colanic/teichoic acid biosynthesis glycosyltransferase
VIVSLKRSFDILFSLIGLLIFSWVIIINWLIAAIETKSNGFFIQKRVGKGGSLFTLIKIKTMKQISGFNTTVTTKNDIRITKWGHFFRRTKLDELPSLWNVLKGDMSLVGPRPDVPGYADKLTGDNRRILQLRPGITGPATLKYANEEQLLANVDDPVKYNDEVIFPDKVRINLEYLDNWNFWLDIKIIFKTIFRSNY